MFLPLHRRFVSVFLKSENTELKGNQVKNLNSPAAVNFFKRKRYILLPLFLREGVTF